MSQTQTVKKRIVFDIETNGLLEDLTTIHCVGLHDLNYLDEDVTLAVKGDSLFNVEEAIRYLMEADELIGHNIIGFDIPAIQKVYPWFKPKGKITDTMVCTRLIWSDIKPLDFKLKRLPSKLIGSHGLEAWGYRLRENKGDFKGPWDTYTDEMGAYCEQDVRVTAKLFKRIEAEQYNETALTLEHEFAQVIQKQQVHGFHFKEAEAQVLYAALCEERYKQEAVLKEVFGPHIERIPFTPKVNNTKRGYVKGVPTEKVIVTEFNPGSRKQIYERFIEKYNWKPKKFTEQGEPAVDGSVLEQLPYPEAKQLAEFLMLEKRIDQLADGKNGWLKLCRKGRIHGSMITNGTPTGRCTHKAPNISQTTSVDKPWGKEFRQLFHPGPDAGFVQLGIDLSGIELRCLAHYLHKYDKGALVFAILQGRNEDGTDMHSRNATALQKYFPKAARNNAKTAIYALMYGAGDKKLGSIVGGGEDAGKKVRKALFEGMVGLEQLTAKIKANLKKRKKSPYLTGLDGRKMPVRSQHSALNTLLQGAGAVIMKLCTVEFHRRMEAAGYPWGETVQEIYNPRYYAQQAHIHDEVQLTIRKDLAVFAGELFKTVVREVGESLNFKCALDAEYKIAANWAETH